MDHETAMAHNAQVPYLRPAGIGDVEGRLIRVPAPVSLAESYATQEHTSVRHGTRVVVRATLDNPLAPMTSDDGFGIAKWLITGWNPLGEPCTLAENLEHNERLLERVKTGSIIFGELLHTTPPDRSWIEDTLVIAGLTTETILEIAREFRQPAITLWQDKFLTIIPTGLVEGLEAVTRELTVELRSLTCPMRIDDVEGAKCAMHGGPYGSSAIHSAAIWGCHRNLLVPRLGCGSCDDGTVATLGPHARARGPIMLDDVCIASRYGGYVWR